MNKNRVRAAYGRCRLLLLLLAVTTGASASGGDTVDGVDAKMMRDCQALAHKLNRSQRLGIRPDGMQPLFTWHASCGERPPTGPGNVTALCDGKRVTRRGEKGVFFWQKSDRGRLHEGYVDCEDAPPPR